MAHIGQEFALGLACCLRDTLRAASFRYFRLQRLVDVGEIRGARPNTSLQLVARPPQFFLDAFALGDFGGEGEVALKKVRGVFRFTLEYRVHADEKPHEPEEVACNLHQVSREKERVIQIAVETGVNQMARRDEDQGQDQPMFKIIGFPGALSQIAGSCQTKKKTGSEFRRPVNQKVWLVGEWQAYETKTQEANSNPGASQQVDDNFCLAVRFQPQVAALPSQQACAHHKR